MLKHLNLISITFKVYSKLNIVHKLKPVAKVSAYKILFGETAT